MFAEDGFHPTSMNEIAEAAGVTKPVLYQHFRSKRDLFHEVLDDVGALLLDEITKATTAAAGPREQVELGFRAYFRFVAEQGDAFQVLFGDGARRDPEFAGQVDQVEGVIAEAIATLIDVEGLSAEGRLVFAHGIVGMAEATGRRWRAQGAEGDPDRLAQAMADLAWRGLRGVRGGSQG